MSEKLPKKETKSKNYSKHQKWESKDMPMVITLLPIYIFTSFFEDLF